MQPAPLWNGNPKSTQVGMVHVRPASLGSAVPSVWPVGACDFFLQAFTRRHVPRATCRRPTRDRHHSRSGVSARPSVPPRSRSDQPFGRCARKCLDTQTDTHTHKHDPANFFSPTHRRKSSFIRTCYAKALAPFILYDFGLEAGIAKHCLGPKS